MHEEQNAATTTINGLDTTKPTAGEEKPTSNLATPTPHQSEQPHHLRQTYGDLVASLNSNQPDNHSQKVDKTKISQHQSSEISPRDYKQVDEQTSPCRSVGDVRWSSNSYERSPSGENVQSNRVSAKEHTPVKTNSSSQQSHCIQDVNSHSVLKTPSPERTSLNQMQSGRVDSSSNGTPLQDKNRNPRTIRMVEEEVVVANSIQGEAAYPKSPSNCSNADETFQTSHVKVATNCKQSQSDNQSQGGSLNYKKTLSNNSNGDVKSGAVRNKEKQAPTRSTPSQNAMHYTKVDNRNSNRRERAQAGVPNRHQNQIHERAEHEQLPKKKSPSQVQPNDPRSNLRVSRRARLPSETEIVDSLYHNRGASSHTPYSIEQSQTVCDNAGNYYNVPPAGAGRKSRSESETSEPSVHLSDDSGPEEFQDYTPSRSASDISLDEKSQQSRGWWTKTQVAKRPQPSHRRHHNSNKQAPAGRGGYYRPPRQRQSDANKDYYIGLGRGRGRPMQMAAQMQENVASNRPFSFGRGNFQRK